MNTFDPQTIKKDFPYFAGEAPSVYLDNAATTQVPNVVLDTMRAYEVMRANVHRGLYAEAITADTMYEDARKRVAQFIGAEPEEVIFTPGATMSVNMLVAMLEHSGNPGRSGLPGSEEGRTFLREGDEIVTTVAEHHANFTPFQKLAERRGAVLRAISFRAGTIELDLDRGEELVNVKTKIVALALASNVTGRIHDIAHIVERAHEVGALVIVDATGAMGHIPVDVAKLGADFLYFSGHKMCGPMGVGVLWGKRALLEDLEPGFYGGGIVDEVTVEKTTWRGVPARFEAGTPNIPGVIALGAAIEYLETIGVENVEHQARTLVDEAIKRLEEIPGVRVVAEKDPMKNIGIVSFTVDGVHPHDVAEVLGGVGIAVRAGHHCAMPLHAELGVTATVRASFYLYNTEEDIEALIAGIKKAKEIFGK